MSSNAQHRRALPPHTACSMHFPCMRIVVPKSVVLIARWSHNCQCCNHQCTTRAFQTCFLVLDCVESAWNDFRLARALFGLGPCLALSVTAVSTIIGPCARLRCNDQLLTQPITVRVVARGTSRCWPPGSCKFAIRIALLLLHGCTSRWMGSFFQASPTTLLGLERFTQGCLHCRAKVPGGRRKALLKREHD